LGEQAYVEQERSEGDFSAFVDDTPDRVDNSDDLSRQPAARAKESGLITLSGFPPAHWKNLFNLELVKQRNKPKEAPKKPPTAPFFLQWRPGQAQSETTKETPASSNEQKVGTIGDNEDEAGWAAAWSEDEDDKNEVPSNSLTEEPSKDITANKELKRHTHSTAILPRDDESKNALSSRGAPQKKRAQIHHHRSQLANLLQNCANNNYAVVTDHIAGLGPSAIDVSISSLCHGAHDLEEGLELLNLATLWLLEAFASSERFEVANAYLHRFLAIHAAVIAGIESGDYGTGNEVSSISVVEQRNELRQNIAKLRNAQQKSSSRLEEKMQSTLALLRHFSRMV